MENSIVSINNNKVVTSSRIVAQYFNKQHKHVLRDVKKLIDSADEKDRPKFGPMFMEATEPDSYGRQQKIVIMNRDGFMLLTMGFEGAKATALKLKFIQAFNAMEEKIKGNMIALPNFNDPAAAARAWANEFEAKQKAQQQLVEANETIAKLEPAADIGNQLVQSDGWADMTTTAHNLGIKGYGRTNLFRLCYRHRVFRDKEFVYQQYIDAGYFKLVQTSPYIDPHTGETKFHHKIVASNRGANFLLRLIRREQASLTPVA